MSSRVEKDDETKEIEIPSRSHKNKELYKQIYNAYDEFENLVVPSNAREIDPNELNKEIVSRQEYKKRNENTTNNSVIRKEKILEEQKQEDDIYDINELISKATSEKKKPELIEPSLANEDYLKKLKLDNRRTNIEQVKEIYEDIKEASNDEDEALMKTANLSLEILSDLKGDSDKTVVSAPIKDEELPENSTDNDFYSSTYKFSRRDFEGSRYERANYDEEDDEEDDGSGKFFFKILMLIFGILLIVLIIIYFINYFGR